MPDAPTTYYSPACTGHTSNGNWGNFDGAPDATSHYADGTDVQLDGSLLNYIEACADREC